MFNDIDNMDEEDISYATSDLRKALNGEILERFPKEIKDRMVAVNVEGDMLRIPTECEIFGENVYGHEESKLTKRWKPMKKKRNRITSKGKEGNWEWYWLMNRDKDCASHFAHVGIFCGATWEYASESKGVRPVFMLSNIEEMNMEDCKITLKQFLEMYSNWNSITRVNDNELNIIVENTTVDIYDERKDLLCMEVVAFGIYDDVMCVRVK